MAVEAGVCAGLIVVVAVGAAAGVGTFKCEWMCCFLWLFQRSKLKLSQGRSKLCHQLRVCVTVVGRSHCRCRRPKLSPALLLRACT